MLTIERLSWSRNHCAGWYEAIVRVRYGEMSVAVITMDVTRDRSRGSDRKWMAKAHSTFRIGARSVPAPSTLVGYGRTRDVAIKAAIQNVTNKAAI